MFLYLGYEIVRFKNGSNKVVIELRVVQFWSEIIPVVSNRTRAARSFDFEIMRMISDLTIYFSNSLMIHQAKTKKITTVKEVLISGPN